LIISGGAGRFFCAGADLRSFYSAPDALKTKVSLFHVAISRIVRAPFPVIAAVNGTAAGGGMGLACSCDLIIAGESAKFIMAYTRRGLTPDGTTTYFLPRRIGVGRAIELAYTNRTLTAREALEWGLVNRVVPDSSLLTDTHALAAELARGATRALAGAKRLMYGGMTESLETQIENEIRSIYEMAATEDTREAIKAFNEKRTPSSRDGDIRAESEMAKQLEFLFDYGSPVQLPREHPAPGLCQTQRFSGGLSADPAWRCA
jgi:2-(1,2-epoxy-1,2-dihydrophenyl)acetyl-CoA isomerase